MHKLLTLALAASLLTGAAWAQSGFGSGSSSGFGSSSSSGSFGSRSDNPRVGSQSDVPLPGAGPSPNSRSLGGASDQPPSAPAMPSGPPTATRCPPGQSYSLTLNSCASVADPNAGRTLPSDMSR